MTPQARCGYCKRKWRGEMMVYPLRRPALAFGRIPNFPLVKYTFKATHDFCEGCGAHKDYALEIK